MNRALQLPLFLVSLLLITGCSDSMRVETYRTAKESHAPKQMPPDMGGGMGGGMGAAPMSGGAVSSVSSGELQLKWDLPQGWVEQAGASSMRLATFGVEGHSASIVALAGDAGGLVANVNRWRGQVGLGDESQDWVSKNLKSAKGKLGTFQWLELVNDKDSGQAMLVALMPIEGMTVFVKFQAPVGVLKKQQAKFLSFCQSLRKA